MGRFCAPSAPSVDPPMGIDLMGACMGYRGFNFIIVLTRPANKIQLWNLLSHKIRRVLEGG